MFKNKQARTCVVNQLPYQPTNLTCTQMGADLGEAHVVAAVPLAMALVRDDEGNSPPVGGHCLSVGCCCFVGMASRPDLSSVWAGLLILLPDSATQTILSRSAIVNSAAHRTCFHFLDQPHVPVVG